MNLRTVRTSKTDPLQIASISIPGKSGVIGITICPGKKDATAIAGPWNRDLKADVQVIKKWSAGVVLCLMEPFELKLLSVEGLPRAVAEAGIEWRLLPIKDVDVPDRGFEQAWRAAGPELQAMLSSGGKVLIHCRGGLGRSGMIAARLLVEAGMGAQQAIDLVRKHRPGAIETKAQEDYVRKMKPSKSRLKNTDAGDRAIGCLMGLAIGDALGTTLEFAARDTKPPVTDLVGGGPFGLKPGEWTDDMSMALCLADSLIACGQLEPLDLMNRFRRWRDQGHNSVTGHCFDIGITTSQAITRYGSIGDPLAGSTDPSSAGNGSIMRLAPVPICFSADQEQAIAAAIAQSRTTHGAAECLDACHFLTIVLVRLLRGDPWTEAIDCKAIKFRSKKIAEIASGNWQHKNRDHIRSTGYVVDTLEAALWAVGRTTSFADAVLLAVNLGHDADTVGAVTGQIAGARYGLKGIPKKWVSRVSWSTHIVDIARRLHSHRIVEK